MTNDRKSLILLVALMVCGIVTYIALINPALGIALGIGIAAATLVWMILQKD
ncbi:MULTISPECIES: hypothetical protein [unclassified Streptomyces]|uniref:hypothetical protein n=1 Tax=unclassified Streptomyces TaxID=2593676 RepID=UPI000889292C|nr:MULTISPECIES: hypothetical protein [unclassified Streptomyces]PBC80205.1 hypothetical protein BX261_0014 [Streptomyces sp. 2321.6]SDQ61685.1 hypothetical protein SAMN05216511_0016 [Streptomyces sp. KS_16]SEB65895.1 hypothetical protein SAMN05428940_0014 [Streptomyces sp. 2133.1]SNC59270.1 hypothetical protein SAMN06272741_0016 [Streptomyces sp. 2114.4]